MTGRELLHAIASRIEQGTATPEDAATLRALNATKAQLGRRAAKNAQYRDAQYREIKKAADTLCNAGMSRIEAARKLAPECATSKFGRECASLNFGTLFNIVRGKNKALRKTLAP